MDTETGNENDKKRKEHEKNEIDKTGRAHIGVNWHPVQSIIFIVDW